LINSPFQGAKIEIFPKMTMENKNNNHQTSFII